MSDVTEILVQIERGDPSVAEQLLPLVYDEVRKLAAAKMAQERPGQTLQATGLVHRAYTSLQLDKTLTDVQRDAAVRLAAARSRDPFVLNKASRSVVQVPGHSSPVFTGTFSSDGQRLAAFAEDGRIKIWDTAITCDVASGRSTASISWYWSITLNCIGITSIRSPTFLKKRRA